MQKQIAEKEMKINFYRILDGEEEGLRGFRYEVTVCEGGGEKKREEGGEALTHSPEEREPADADQSSQSTRSVVVVGSSISESVNQ